MDPTIKSGDLKTLNESDFAEVFEKMAMVNRLSRELIAMIPGTKIRFATKVSDISRSSWNRDDTGLDEAVSYRRKATNLLLI